MKEETMPQDKDHTPPDTSKLSYRKTMQRNAAKKLREGGTLNTNLIIALFEMDDD